MKSFSGRVAVACQSIVIMMHLIHRSWSWVPSARSFVLSRPASLERSLISPHHVRIFSSRRGSSRGGGNLEVDEEGRRIRRSSGGGGWDDFDPTSSVQETKSSGGWDDFDPTSSIQETKSSGGWDDFDPMNDAPDTQRRPPKSNRIRSDSRNSNRNESRGSNRSSGTGPPRRSFRRENTQDKAADDRKINLKALDGAGFVHLYGLSSVLNALQANRRDFTRPETLIDLDQLSGEDLEHEQKQRERKPEAQFSPWLLVQERTSKGGRNTDKAMAAEQVEQLAKERNVPIATVDKGVLNTLSGNRPHQVMLFGT